jgi:transposase
MSDYYQADRTDHRNGASAALDDGTQFRIIEASCEPGELASSPAARRHGVTPNLLYRWRRLMAQAGAAVVGSEDPVVGNSEVRRLDERL